MKSTITFEALGKTQTLTLDDWQAHGHHRLYISDGRKQYGYYDMKAEQFVGSYDTISSDWCEGMKTAVLNFIAPVEEITEGKEIETEAEEEKNALSPEEVEKQFDEVFDLLWDWCEGHDDAPFVIRREKRNFKIINADTNEVLFEGESPQGIYKEFLNRMEG